MTEEFPLRRSEGSPLGQGLLPGDLARIEVGSFRHEMNLKEVLAFFEHEDDDGTHDGDARRRTVIALCGQPEEIAPSSGSVKYSEVSLRATVPADAAPGVYRFQRLEAETYGGRRVPFDASTQERWRRWRFLVMEESDTPPTI